MAGMPNGAAGLDAGAWIAEWVATNNLSGLAGRTQADIQAFYGAIVQGSQPWIDATQQFFQVILGGFQDLSTFLSLLVQAITGVPGALPGLTSFMAARWNQLADALLNIGDIFGAFGGSLIMKLAEVDGSSIKRAVMCNPAGFVNINMSLGNLYNLLLPMIFPSQKSVMKFLDRIVFHKDFQFDSQKRGQLAEFLLYTNQNFKMNTENPRPFPDETLQKLNAPSYLILDRDDIFIDQQKTQERAEKLLPNLVETVWLEKHGHGIELADEIGKVIKNVLEK